MGNLKQYLFHGQTKDDGIIPYLSAGDFIGLKVKKSRAIAYMKKSFASFID